jgi:hypothetical protein
VLLLGEWRSKVWRAPVKEKNRIAGEKNNPMYRCRRRNFLIDSSDPVGHRLADLLKA